MPKKSTARRANQRKREGKAPTTQAGEYVREEMHHMKEGRHSARNPKQAIAIGLSKARREGVDLKPPAKGKTSSTTRKKAARDYERGASKRSGSRSAAKSAGRKTARKSTGSARRSVSTSTRRSARASGDSSGRGTSRAPAKSAARTSAKKAGSRGRKTAARRSR